MSESLKDSLSKKITNYLSNRSNTVFLVLVNYRPAYLGSEDKSIYVRYNGSPECKQNPLEFGIRRTVNGRSTFEKTNSAADSILNRLMETNVLSVNLEFDEDDIDITCEHNMDLKVINIVQSTFKSLLDLIYVKDTKGDITLAKQGIPLSMEIRNILYDRFEEHMMRSYITLGRKRLFRFISMRKADIQFYYIFKNVFNVVFVQGECIFNPLLDCERNRRMIEKTRLYNESLRHRKTYKNMNIYFATDKSVCEAIGISSGIDFNNIFLMNILFGFINDGFPNDRVVYYQSRIEEESILTEEQYLKLEPMERAEFVRITTLYDYCDRNSIRLGEQSGATLYDKLSKASLL